MTQITDKILIKSVIQTNRFEIDLRPTLKTDIKMAQWLKKIDRFHKESFIDTVLFDLYRCKLQIKKTFLIKLSHT